MAPDDDIDRRILEGDAYDRASLTARTLALRPTRAVTIAAGAAASTASLAPAVWVRRDLVGSLEPPLDATPFALALATVALLGVLTAVAAGGLLLHRHRVAVRRSPDADAAERLVRIENLLTWFLLQGVVLSALPTAAAIVGAVAPGTVETAYRFGIAIYAPGAVDARVVSAAGAALGGGLLAARIRYAPST